MLDHGRDTFHFLGENARWPAFGGIYRQGYGRLAYGMDSLLQVRPPRDFGTLKDRFMATFDLTPPSSAQREAIIARLTGEEREVLLEHGTEAAFCGVFLDNHKDGVYTCRFCGLPLFRSTAKFDSGTGWPSFFEPYDEAHIRRVRDTSYGMVRVEEVCARCGSHLGHVFPDGPPPTGERHCLNSVSLSFTEQGQALPDILGRGLPEGTVPV